jgi:hypothetical protein
LELTTTIQGDDDHEGTVTMEHDSVDLEAATNDYVYDMHIDAPVEDVFPLLCPVRENDWVIGWEEMTTLISSESGFAELGAVFQTQHPGEAAEAWVITQYEPMERIAFARFGGDVVTRLEIDLAEVHGKTRATWTTSQVATSASGNARVEAVTQDSHDASRTGLEVMLKYYLATGEMIDAEKLHERLEAPAHR